jgi:hypothetical protein
MLAIASGCHVVFPIEPYGDGDGGIGSAPRVFATPGPAWVTYGGYPKTFAITLAADQPGTVIYYTTDGSTPTMASTASATPITGITISANTTVKFFGVHGGAASSITTEEFKIDTATAQSNAGFLVTNTKLDGTSPVVVAAAGAMLSARADLQVWVQGACPACRAQVVYGIGNVDQGCAYDANPGIYAGVTMPNRAFSVRAPMIPGVYEVVVVHIEETGCAAAMSAMALSTRDNDVRIGVIVVR